jgi:16S rRNA (guanine966-N2)-methyltransferase
VRVIAGSARGRTLSAPPGRGTRPTSDRVREALFSSLADEVPGAVVLDLFAGSGALGIEALSRGAGYAVFVDDDRRAVRTVRDNLAAARLAARALVLQADAARFCAAPAAALGRRDGPPGPFDLVFCDPPYALALPAVLGLLGDLAGAGALARGAVAVVERDRRDADLERPGPARFVHDRDRVYGDTLLRYLRLSDQEPAA